jgi:hypothetical protein
VIFHTRVLFCHAPSASLGGMRFLRAECGQATADYVALIVLLAVLLAAAAGITATGAPGAVNAVLGQLRRALCLVGGGDCPLAPRLPCTVASTRDAHHVAVNLGIVRLDEDTVVLRERLSDGTVRLTVSHRDGGGVEGGVGGKGKIDARGHEIGFEVEARGGIEGVLGHGEVYYARTEREADKLLDAIRGGGGPRASEVFFAGGVRALGRVDGRGAHVLTGRLDALADATLGLRHDRRNGQDTISLGAGSSGMGLVSAAIGSDAGALDGQVVLGLALDRHHRPVELTVSATGRVADGAMLPAGIADALRQAADPRTSSSTGGRRWEFGARVDLHDPAVAGAWKAFRRSPTSTAAIRALGEQLRTHASLDVRSYRLDGSFTGISGSVALGIKIGGEYEHTTNHAQLMAAVTRPPLGLWEARVDCVRAA